MSKAIKAVLIAISLVIVQDSFAAELEKQKALGPIVMDGKLVESAVLSVDGKPFVDLNALGSLLGWKIQATNSVVVVESRKLEGLQAAVPNEGGTVSGTITYFFNRNYGAKPDVGSAVYLVKYAEGFYLSDQDSFYSLGSEIVINRGGGDSKYPVVAKASVDGNGRYELKNVPPGKYYLLMKSAHSKGNSKRDVLGKVLFSKVDVANGNVVDVSNDFGMSAY